MLTLVLAAGFLLPASSLAAPALRCQDGDLDRIMLQFQRRWNKNLSEGQKLQLLADARTELEQFLKDYPTHRDAPRAAFQIAETYLSARDFDRASEKLRGYLKDYPSASDAPAARFALAEILLEKEKDAEARASFEEFAKLYPSDERTLFARMYSAVTLQNERRYDEAAVRLRAVREEFKGRKESWSALMQLGIISHVQEKNAEALRTLEEIIRDCPEKEVVEIARRHLAEYLKLGSEAPLFTEKDLEGHDVSLEKLQGKVVVIYFFEPGDVAALTEAAFLKRAREEAAQAGQSGDLEILGISIGTDHKEMALYKAAARADWPLLFDGRGIDGKVAQKYDVKGLPCLVVLDRKGRRRFFNLAGRDFRYAIAKLLQEK